MGFLDAFRKPRTPMVSSILPDIAKQEILNGRLPIRKRQPTPHLFFTQTL